MTQHNVTRQTATAVVNEVEAAVAAIFASHGLTKPKVKVTYGDYLKVALESYPDKADDNGVQTVSPEAIAYQRYHGIYNLPADGLGATFTVRGEEYKIVGLSPNRPKYPVNAVRSADGAPFKFGADTVARLVVRTVPA